MSPETKQLYEFGDFRLDLSEKVLMRGGKPVSITPKVFSTLIVLVENAGRLVEKDELMRRIWHDRCVEESNLTFNVKMLRKALGDSASEPRFIETVPRRGYRFIAEVREIIVASAGAHESRPVAPVAKPSNSYRRTALFAALLIVSALLGTWLILGRADPAPILSAPFGSEKFSASGKINHAVISPDGKFVAYVDETGGRVGIWLRRPETAENVQIVPPSEDFYLGLAFSHDGESLYFVRKPVDEMAPTAVYRVSPFGGIPERILEGAEG